jgi:Leucine-rich repeat (LRR) protein
MFKHLLLFSVLLLINDGINAKVVDCPKLYNDITTNYDISDWFTWEWEEWSATTTGTGCCDWKGIICTDAGELDMIQLSTSIKTTLKGDYSYIHAVLVEYSDSLRIIDLQWNEFTGNLLSFANFPKLERLYLNQNEGITGSMPTDWTNMPKLERLSMQNMGLSGSVAKNLPSTLSYLYLSDNAFTGTIPIEWDNLDSVVYLWLDNTELTGWHPDLVLDGLLVLRFYNTKLTGDLEWLGNQPYAGNIDISYNPELNSNLPSKLSLNGGHSLRAINTPLTGEIPVWYESRNFNEIRLTGTQLEGYLPALTVRFDGSDCQIATSLCFTNDPSTFFNCEDGITQGSCSTDETCAESGTGWCSWSFSQE